MTFGLINGNATYQMMMNKKFSSQLVRNMEVYVNDIIINSKQTKSHIDDLEDYFHNFRKHNMKLNPHNCSFGHIARKLLGHMVSERGFEEN